MNLIYILYRANNKVGLVAQWLPFKLEVMSSIPKQHLSPYLKVARTSKECNKVPYMNVMKSRFNDNLKYFIIYIFQPI